MDCEGGGGGDRECDGSRAAPLLCGREHTLAVKLPQTVIDSIPLQSRPLFYMFHAVSGANDK